MWDAGAVVGHLNFEFGEFTGGMIESESLMRAFPPMVLEFLENPLIALIEVAKEVGHELTAMVGEVMGTANAMGLAAQKAGFGVEEFSKYAWAAKTVNLSAEQLGVGIKMLQRNAADAAQGIGEGAKYFHQLGISQQDLNRNLDDGAALFRLVMEGMGGVTTSAQRTELAVKLLGRAGSDLVPLFAMGQAGVDAFAKSIEGLGAMETGESVKLGQAWKRLQVQMEAAWEGIKKTFAEDLAPQLMPMLETFLAWVKAHMPEIREHVQRIAQAVADAAKVIGPILLYLLEHLNVVIGVLGAAGLAVVVPKAIGLIGGLAEAFLALTGKIAGATAAETAFNLAAAARTGGLGASIGGTVGAVGFGDLGGTIGGSLGGLLGGLIGQALIPIPGVGFLIGSGIGGYAGAATGSAIEQHFHANVTAQFDPHEAAQQFADRVVPKIQEQYFRQMAEIDRMTEHAGVARATGGKNPHHYQSGF